MTDKPPDFATPFNHPQNPLLGPLNEGAPDTPLSDLPVLDPRDNRDPVSEFEQAQAAIKNGSQAVPVPSLPPASAPPVAEQPASSAGGGGAPPPAGKYQPSYDELLAMLAERQRAEINETVSTGFDLADRSKQVQLIVLGLIIAGGLVALAYLAQRRRLMNLPAIDPDQYQFDP